MLERTTTVLLLAALGGAAACGTSSPSVDQADAGAEAPAEVRLTDEQIASAGIVVTALEEASWAEEIEVPAVLQLDQRRTARVGALLDGRVDAVRADVGDAVRQGDVLAELHSHLTHDAVADLRKALSTAARLETELAFAVSAEGRARRLLADGAASPQDVERAATTVSSLRRELEIAQADQERARAELGYYGVDLTAIDGGDSTRHHDDHVPIRAPIAGTVLERLVTPGTTVTSGQPMFVISDLATLWVVGEVDERAARLLQRGRTATVRVGAFPDDSFTATVTAIGDVVAADTRRITVRAELPNRDRRLKPEMYARLVLAGEDRTALTVPGEAIQHLDGRDVVFVETTPGRFVPTPVRIAPVHASGDRVAVLEGLAPGDRVVTGGAFLVRSEFQKALLAEDE